MFKLKIKKPKNYKEAEGLIPWWDKLDTFVHMLSNKKAVKYWEKFGIPHRYICTTKEMGYLAYPFMIVSENKKERELTYKDILDNRYLWSENFLLDKCERIINVFNNTLMLANCAEETIDILLKK